MVGFPKVSIVTPSYNQGQFLEQTILSVLNQDYPNLEYIIVDGGSTDNSIEIIKIYEERLAYWISEPDKGQSDAINKGFLRATGEILSWLNSDDLLLPGAINSVVSFFNEHPDIGCVIGDQEVIDSDGKYLCTVKNIPFKFRRTLYGGSMVPQPSTFFTKNALDVTGKLNIDLHYNMDYEFFLRMAYKGIKFDNIKKPLSAFRLHKSSKTVSEYYNRVKQDNFKVRKRYSKLRLGNDSLTYITFGILKWFYRLEAFLIRVIIRRDFIPFKATYARRAKIDKGSEF